MKTILLKTLITWGPFKNKVGEVEVQIHHDPAAPEDANQQSLTFAGNVGLLGLQTELKLSRTMEEFKSGKSLRVTLQKGATPLIELSKVDWHSPELASAQLNLLHEGGRPETIALEVHRKKGDFSLMLAQGKKPTKQLHLHLAGVTLTGLRVAKYQFS